uniref:Uncharacterized protein n=1 Tax=Ditylenchus dipsaci TaxID=166011 RepID=A0A915CTK8_9BILA
MASLELIIDALNFLSFKEKCSIVFLSKCLNTNLMPQVKLQRKQIFDKERNLFKLKLSLKCQLTSYRANQNQLKNQRKTLSRQYYENLTALQFLNVPAQQRQQQEAVLNATYSQQVGLLCQQIKAYDCKKAFVLAKFTIFKLGFKRDLFLVAPQEEGEVQSSSPAKPCSILTASHPGLQLCTQPSYSSSGGPSQRTEVKQPDVQKSRNNQGTSAIQDFVFTHSEISTATCFFQPSENCTFL